MQLTVILQLTNAKPNHLFRICDWCQVDMEDMWGEVQVMCRTREAKPKRNAIHRPTEENDPFPSSALRLSGNSGRCISEQSDVNKLKRVRLLERWNSLRQSFKLIQTICKHYWETDMFLGRFIAPTPNWYLKTNCRITNQVHQRRFLRKHSYTHRACFDSMKSREHRLSTQENALSNSLSALRQLTIL